MLILNRVVCHISDIANKLQHCCSVKLPASCDKKIMRRVNKPLKRRFYTHEEITHCSLLNQEKVTEKKFHPVHSFEYYCCCCCCCCVRFLRTNFSAVIHAATTWRGTANSTPFHCYYYANRLTKANGRRSKCAKMIFFFLRNWEWIINN